MAVQASGKLERDSHMTEPPALGLGRARTGHQAPRHPPPLAPVGLLVRDGLTLLQSPVMACSNADTDYGSSSGILQWSLYL